MGQLPEAEYGRVTWGTLQESYLRQITGELPVADYGRVT